jgi:hypothetical protein
MHTYDFEPFTGQNFRIFGVSGAANNFMGLREVNVNECNVITDIIVTETSQIILTLLLLFVMLSLVVLSFVTDNLLLLLLAGLVTLFVAFEAVSMTGNYIIGLFISLLGIVLLSIPVTKYVKETWA